MKGKLILEDGRTFFGTLIDNGAVAAEVVFNTGMTGYQEILTDPSYCGQIIVLTYPLIGNYGINSAVDQSRQCFASGFVVGNLCACGSNWQKEAEIGEFFAKQNLTCLYDVDTRALVRHLRSLGTMRGIIVPASYDERACEALFAEPRALNTVSLVTTPKRYTFGGEGFHVAVMDFGVKRHMLESLQKAGCRVTVMPAFTPAAEVLALNPDGIFLSNGPGDPKDVPEICQTVKELIGKKPIFGICLGHQLIALASGADTYKMKFGHRGSNQPVQDLRTGKIYISSQNHGYAVDERSLLGLPLEITHRSVNDNTVEGLRHKTLPLFSVQYHPEASPGPDDNTYLFAEFVQMMKKGE